MFLLLSLSVPHCVSFCSFPCVIWIPLNERLPILKTTIHQSHNRPTPSIVIVLVEWYQNLGTIALGYCSSIGVL